jgi:hypothetical protein
MATTALNLPSPLGEGVVRSMTDEGESAAWLGLECLPHPTCCAGHLLPQGEKKEMQRLLTIRTYSYYSSSVISCRTSGAAGTVRGDPQLERFFASPLSRNWNR